jgi:histidine triad (HIT) family protein
MIRECIFCKIIKNEIPSYKIYEDGDFYAFLDISPRNPGHTLLIPKKHYRWVWDIENIGAFFSVARKIALAQKKAFKTDYIVSLIFGEEVEHAHLWVIPRFENDGHGGAINLENIKILTEKEMRKAQRDIIKEL